ncbi:hypothetical protein GWN42_30375 [candidate division KSB1 bacterium]|nr:hypothetical protein [candidate division KSB1 bacterium]
MLSTLRKNVKDFVGEFPAVTKIVIFGSLVRPGYFREYSDIDVVVWNLPNSEYWRAISWFEDCLDTENIDLVRIEDAHPRMIKYIEMGEIIYEKEV